MGAFIYARLFCNSGEGEKFKAVERKTFSEEERFQT